MTLFMTKIVFGFLLSVCTVLCLRTTLIEGDVYVEVIDSVYNKVYENGTCYDINSDVVQNIEAIKWTFDKLNTNNFIHGVKIGMRLSSTCRSVGRAEEAALDLVIQMRNRSDNDIVGVLGPSFSSETQAVSGLLSSLPEKYRLLQIGYASTSESLKNRDIYKNFFRTIPSDDLQVKVMTEFFEKLNWTYLALVYDNDTYGRGGRDALIKRIASKDVCFPVQIPVDPTQYNVSRLETDLKTLVMNVSVPIGGVLVFGSYSLAMSLLMAAENIVTSLPTTTRPVFLLSEAGGTIEGQSLNISRGMFVLSPPRRHISEFQDHLANMFTEINDTTIISTWIKDLYDKYFCENNNCVTITKNEFQQKLSPSVYNQYAIKAALVMAKAVETVYTRVCEPLASAMCKAMYNVPRQEFIDVMDKLTVSFDDDFGNVRIEEFKEPGQVMTFSGSAEASVPANVASYEVFNHQMCRDRPERNCLFKIATFSSDGYLTLHTSEIRDYEQNGNELKWPNIRKPQCPDGHLCLSCLLSHSDDDAVLFVPGDVYVVGTVPVHGLGPTPLKCGGIKTGGLDLVEVIRFAVTEAKQIYKEKVPDADIGVIVIDTCNDPQITQEKILTLQRRGVFKDGVYIPVGEKIIAYISDWISDITKASAAVTTRLGYPQIAYGATAPILSNRDLYPYFLRVPSPDNEQAKTILKIVNQLGINLIQLVYSKTAYGEGGRDSILEIVASMGICVAGKPIGVSESTDASELLTILRQHSGAQAVVIFSSSFELEKFIKGLNDNVKRNEFLFIGSEGWGTRINVSDYSNLVGSITITSELPINAKFQEHMKDLKPGMPDSNPWIISYMEHFFECYYEWSYNKTSGRKCRLSQTLDASTIGYKIEAWAPFLEKAVTTLLMGAKEALDTYCGSSKATCANMRNNTQGFVDIIKRQKLLDENRCLCPIYNTTGDGLAGYKIYAVTLGDDGQYKKIGSSIQGILDFRKETFAEISGSVINSTCAGQGYCKVCFPEPKTGTVDEGLPLGVIVAMAILSLICCILTGILLYICNRQGCCFKIEEGHFRFSHTYLTPVYMEQGDGIQNTSHTAGGEVDYHHIKDYNRDNTQQFGRKPPNNDMDSPIRAPSDTVLNERCGALNNYVDGTEDVFVSLRGNNVAYQADGNNVRDGQTSDDDYITACGASSVRHGERSGERSGVQRSVSYINDPSLNDRKTGSVDNSGNDSSEDGTDL